MELITSSSNGKIKLASSLLQRKNRDKQGLFLVEGLRNVELIVETGRGAKIKYCFITENMAKQPRCEALINKLQPQQVLMVTEELLGKISEAVTPQGVVVVMAQPNYLWEDFTEAGPLLILDRIMDPGNVGTIIRTADAFGARGIVALKGTTDLFAPKVIRSAMGSIFAKPILQNISLQELDDYVNKTKLKIYLADLDQDAVPLSQGDLTGNVGIVMGNEANGVDEELKKKYSNKLYIPMVGNAESLNVAMATAIIMYEFRR